MFFKERRHERYGYKAPVLFRRDGRELWDWGITNDISLGGIFLNTDTDGFTTGTVLTLQIASLVNGTLFSIDGRIVRVAENRGLGIEFVGAAGSPELKAVIAYLKAHWSPLREGPPATPWEREKALTLARELLDRAQFMDYYRIMDLTPDASEQEIVEKAKTFLEVLTISERGLSDIEKRTLREAIALVKRLGGILANSSRRYAYNIAVGIDLEGTARRIIAEGLDLAPFAQYYAHRYKDRAAKAEEILARLKDALQRGDTVQASQLRKEGRQLNPFIREFWEE